MEHIDDVQSDRIDQYLRGEMSPAERSAFERSVAENPVLQAALAERRDLVRGIHDAVWGNLRLAMDEELDALEREEEEERRRRWRKIGLWAGAGAVLLVGLWLGWLWFFQQEKPSEQILDLQIVAFGDSTKLDTSKSSLMIFNPPAKRFDTDTAQDQKKEETRPPQQKRIPQNQATRPDTTQTKPIADRAPKKDSSVPVATPENPLLANLTQVPARRILVSAGQKTSEEPLPAIRLETPFADAMQCAFYGNKLRLFVPPDFAEGQPVEIVQLRGAGAADGYYLKVGPQIYPMKNDRGHPFRLAPLPDGPTLRLLLE